MSKPTMGIMAPFPTRSGYGSHSRDIIRGLMKSELYDIKLFPLRWGNTPMNALKTENEHDAKMLNLIPVEPLQEKLDIFLQITIPLEFKRGAKYSIGITAGIETDRVALPWIEKVNNEMDLMIVPSEHSKEVHINSSYDMKQSPDGPVIGQIRNTKPIEILFEGVDTEIYKPEKVGKLKGELSVLNEIEEDFCFLYVGHWLNGGHREDRKDVGGAIANFIKAFKYKKGRVALVLKSSISGFSRLDRAGIMQRIKSVQVMMEDEDIQPTIYLLHGDLTDQEMNTLYNHPKILAMISCTHGEGYGRPLAEFATATGKPVLAPNWSGQLEYLDGSMSTLFKTTMNEIPKSVIWENIIVEGSSWANVVDEDVVSKLQRCYHKYDTAFEKGKQQQQRMIDNFTLAQMEEKLIEIIDKYKPIEKSTLVMPGNLKLPQLTKIE